VMASRPSTFGLDPLAREVDRLGRLLGDVIREQEGQDAFELVEAYRAATKALRAPDERPEDFGEGGRRLLARTATLDADRRRLLIRAFTAYFHLVNLAEERHRLRVLDERQAQDPASPRVESIAAVVRAAAAMGVSAESFRERLSSENAMQIFSQFDIIVNGCDNFPTRYLANDACVMLKKPLVDGAIWQFEGQATVFKPFEGPCYRCLFPEPTPPELAPSCDEAGVLGVLPGVVGLIQATEAVKLILGRGRSLAGRLLTYDALEMAFREYEVARDPGCAVCGERPTIRELKDLEWSCHMGTRPREAATATP